MRARFHKHKLRWILGGSLALALTLVALARVVQAACGGGNLSDFCSSNFGLSGDLTETLSEDWEGLAS